MPYIYNNVKTIHRIKEDGKDFIMNTEYEKRLGKHIRFLRKKKKLTQELLAARFQVAGCDITRSTIAKIEVGQRHIYADEIVLLCSILNVNYEDFFI